jgi:hypothetical protein
MWTFMSTSALPNEVAQPSAIKKIVHPAENLKLRIMLRSECGFVPGKPGKLRIAAPDAGICGAENTRI